MRKINKIVLHCTASHQTATVEGILNYWKKTRGWKSPGYHFLIEPNGHVNELLPIKNVSNGVRGHNHDSIHISYIGGIDSDGKPFDNRTEVQKIQQVILIEYLKKLFPNAKIMGHRDFEGVHKACPSFDVTKWLKEVGISNV